MKGSGVVLGSPKLCVCWVGDIKAAAVLLPPLLQNTCMCCLLTPIGGLPCARHCLSPGTVQTWSLSPSTTSWTPSPPLNSPPWLLWVPNSCIFQLSFLSFVLDVRRLIPLLIHFSLLRSSHGSSPREKICLLAQWVTVATGSDHLKSPPQRWWPAHGLAEPCGGCPPWSSQPWLSGRATRLARGMHTVGKDPPGTTVNVAGPNNVTDRFAM